MASDTQTPSLTKATQQCRIYETLQHSCDVVRDPHGGQPQIHCFPFPRIFRICKNRPAVEITKFVKINSATGEVDIPPESSDSLPKGKPWRDVIKYE